MTAHQQFGQFTVAIGDRIENAVVLGEGLVRTIGRGGELDAVHAHQLVQLAAEHLRQGAVAAALDDPVMKVEVAFLLVVADAGLERLIAFVGFAAPGAARRFPRGSCARRPGRQAMPSRDSRISYSSISSAWLSDTTRAPTWGTRTSRRWPSRRWIASRSGPRLMP